MRFFLVILFLTLLGCSSESGPINLPIPFSGALTSDTNIASVEGAPISGGNTFPIIWNASWQSVEGPLVGGTFTFHSLTNLNVLNGGSNREYTLDYSATVGSDLEVRVNEASCFEFPLSDPPSEELANFAATVGGTPRVKKLICSGNITSCQGDCTVGELVDFKSVVGVVELIDGTVQFHTQDKSALYVQGSSFLLSSGNTESKVALTIIADGFIADLPLDALPEGQPEVIRSFAIPLFFPGSDEQVGSEIIHTHNVTVLPNGAIDLELTVDFIIGSSFVRMHNVHDIVNALPAANEPLDILIESNFLDDPNFSDQVLTENGGVAFFPTVTETDPVNCDPAANEATGIFRELCEEFGTVNADFRCLIKFNPQDPVPPAFFSQGAWFFSSP